MCGHEGSEGTTMYGYDCSAENQGGLTPFITVIHPLELEYSFNLCFGRREHSAIPSCLPEEVPYVLAQFCDMWAIIHS